MTTTQRSLWLRACDADYAELIDGRYPRTLKELPGPQVPLVVARVYSFWEWLDDIVFPSRIEEFRQ